MKRSSRPTESFGCAIIHGFGSGRKVRCHKVAVDSRAMALVQRSSLSWGRKWFW